MDGWPRHLSNAAFGFSGRAAYAGALRKPGMDYGRLQRFVARHGNVAVFDVNGGSHRVHDATPDSQKLVENAEQFLWDGLMRSRAEMEDLVAQSERGLAP